MKTLIRPSVDSWLGCRPRYATPRCPERATLGPHLADLAAELGKPLMPWQRQVADIALEVDPDSGLLVYREVDLVVMRQQGKTELLLPVMTHRSLGFGGDQRILYTSQTGAEARKKWEDVHLKRLEASPLGLLFTARLRLAAEAFLWRNGSVWSPVSATAKTGGTGDSIDLGVIDEAWSRDDSRTEQGMRPAMLTRDQPQLWVVSMVPGPTRAKTTASTYLRGKMTAGRLRAEAGLTRDVAYFEFSADPGMDPADPATWWSCMPALGRTISEAAVRADFEALPLEDFTSEYLGWWPDETGQGWQVIGQPEWAAARVSPDDPGSRLLDPVALAVVVAPDRSWSAIAAAGRRAGGGRQVEVTGTEEVGDYRPGTGWVLPRLKELVEQHRPCAVVVADRALADTAEKEKFDVSRATSGDLASAAGMLYDGVAGVDLHGRDVYHLGQGELDTSVKRAAKRIVGDTWLWDRRDQPVDITPLVCASLALWALGTPRVHRKVRDPAAAFVDVNGRPVRERAGSMVRPAVAGEDVNAARLREQLERMGVGG